MEDTNTSKPKDRKMMDPSTVWQWRIMHVKKYSRTPEPFHYSEKNGLDFNVGSKTQKLDLKLLTNGVMLEICDFAKMVTKGKSHFIMNILENNFDLGLENEQQRNNFRSQIIHKLKDLMRKPPKEKFDVVTLFGVSSVPECTSNIKKELNMASKDQQYVRFQVKMENNATHKNKLTCSVGPQPDVSDDEEEMCLGPQLKEEIKGDVLPLSYPFCEEIGLNFESGSKQYLDPGLLTNGMMVEMVDFTRVLTASYSSIVLSVLKHNFELDLQSQQAKKQVLFGVAQLLKKRKKLTITGTKISPQFKNDLFETNPFKRAPAQSTMEELLYESLKKRRKFHLTADVPSEFEMEEEEFWTETNMWKLRANRVKQIMLVLDKDYWAFYKPSKVNLEFNIGFRSKKILSADYLTNSVLYKVARFALALNSSQQEFIMEILEKNFNLGLKSKCQKSAFACELMSRIRQLQKCENGVKFSNEVFELPGSVLSVSMTSQSIDNVGSDVAPSNVPDSHTETTVGPNAVIAPETPVDLHETQPNPHVETGPETIKSEKSVDLYPFCKQIGLKLHVSCSQQTNKLDINKLTKGAMMEVTNFAEKLCGTFEQVCLDIIRHNFDLDLQNADSDLARNILAHISAANEERNLVTRVTHLKSKHPKRDYPILSKLNCQNTPNTETCSDDSSQAIVLQNVGSSIEQQNDLNSVLWRLRANQIRQVLSVPHGELCPLYSYSRCKKLGINFNAGSGVKQNLDPKLLTNGIMVEVNTFAEALLSSTKDFITEILEYNFDLNLNSEPYRNAFAKKLMRNCGAMKSKKLTISQKKMLFELPDLKSIDEYMPHCPKCYQDRNKFHQDNSHSSHMLHQPHAITSVPADANCTPQKPPDNQISTSPSIEQMIMSWYTSCRRIGLRLCVDKAQRKRKLERRALTWEIMCEVYSFARKLSGTKHKLVNDVLEHNFNLDKQSLDLNPSMLFCRVQPRDGEHAWFDDVFVIQPARKCPLIGTKREGLSAMQRSERKETIRKRQLDMQAKRKRAMLSNDNKMDNVGNFGHLHPMCKEMELGLDETAEGDDCYMCPIEADTITDSENSGNEDDVENPTTYHNLKESESSCLGVPAPFLNTTGGSSSSGTKNTDVYPLSASHSDECGLKGHEEEEVIPIDVSNDCDMEEAEIGTESNLWKLRANRVKQILLILDKDYCPYFRPKKVNVEFNIGFRPKKNLSADYLTNSVLYKVARFALAMSSSQQEFIMEILEKNFNLGPQSPFHSYTIACELMSRIRQLQKCEDVGKFSNEVFELPESMLLMNMASQSMDSVSYELSNISRMKESGVVPSDAPDSHSETRTDLHAVTSSDSAAGPHESEPETVKSEKNVDLYPFCKQIGLKLHVSCSQQTNKLDINKLTKGAMMEVTNFAEKLCGKFEQICLDIIRHNFDLDLQNVDLASHILAQIPTANDHRNVATWVAQAKQKSTRKDYPIFMKLDYQHKPTTEACSTGSAQTVVHQNVRSSTDFKQENDLNSVLWRLRAKQTQRILSVPHGELCPLYSYSRCKKLGIDFNVGSGLKQNLDPKLLTNGIMVEVNTFAEALLSSTKDFITEILEYNFNLNLNSEPYRSTFGEQLMQNITTLKSKKFTLLRKKKLFTLPDSISIDGYAPDCPKCHQDQNYKLDLDESDSVHMVCQPHAMTSVISIDTNCTSEKPLGDGTPTSPAVEQTILNTYPLCKKIGLSLCVDNNHPKPKLDTHVLTWEVLWEVYSFARKLCGTKHKLVNDVLEHNFSLDKQSLDMNPSMQFYRVNPHDGEPTWFSEVFVIQPPRMWQIIESAEEDLSAVQRNEWKETVRKRQMDMQAKKERDKLLSHNAIAVTLAKNKHKNMYPICKKIGLDLDVASKSGHKKKLNLKLLTSSVLLEIQKFAATKRNQYFPATLYDILDYNFNISSQHHRRWEFSIAAATKFHSMVKQYRNTGVEKVFKLPFLFGPKYPQSSTHSSFEATHSMDENKQVEPTSGHAIQILPLTIMQMNVTPMNTPTISPIFAPTITSIITPTITCLNAPTIAPITTPTVSSMNTTAITSMNTTSVASFTTTTTAPINIPMNPLLFSPTIANMIEGCNRFLPGNMQIKEEEHDPRYGNTMPLLDHPSSDNIRTESATEAVKYLVPGQPAGSLGHTLVTKCPGSESSNGSKSETLAASQVSDGGAQIPCPNIKTVIKTESDTEVSLDYYMITVGQDTEIKEEQENVPTESFNPGVVSSAESQVDVKQECES